MVTIHITAFRVALGVALVVFAASWYLLSTEPTGASVILCPGTTRDTQGLQVVCGVDNTYRAALEVGFYSVWRALLVAAVLLGLNWARKRVRFVPG